MEQPDRAQLIFNASSGRPEASAQQLLDALTIMQDLDLRVEVHMVRPASELQRVAREAIASGTSLIVVAGGDGTIEEVASQLVGTKTTMGIIPVGTINNLARALGVPLELDDACALLAMGVSRRIDVGRVHAHAKPDVEYFLETAGVGLMAIAIPAGQAAEKGKWAKLPLALRKLFDVQPHPVEVQLDTGEVIKANSQLVTVSNSPLMGKNILIAPDAKMDDGVLDIAVYDGMGKAELLSYFMSAASGNRTYNPKIRFYRSRHVVIHSDQPIEAHSDKDVIEGKQTLEIEVVSQALYAIVGQGFALTLPATVVPLAGSSTSVSLSSARSAARASSSPWTSATLRGLRAAA